MRADVLRNAILSMSPVSGQSSAVQESCSPARRRNPFPDLRVGITTGIRVLGVRALVRVQVRVPTDDDRPTLAVRLDECRALVVAVGLESLILRGLVGFSVLVERALPSRRRMPIEARAVSSPAVVSEPPTPAGTAAIAPANDEEVATSNLDAPSFIRRHAYGLFAALLVVAMAGQTLNQKWASPDFWVHLAAVREFAHSLLDPGNPLVVGGTSDPYLSPYTFGLGAIVRATGSDAVDVLAVAGLVNLVLLLFGIRRFVVSISTAEFAPLLTLVFTLTAWGFSTWRWSGFFSLNSLGTVLPLSSTFASAVGLFTIVAICSWLRGGGGGQLVVVGVGGPLVLLSHPMTAMWVGLVGVAFVISELRGDNVRRVLTLLGVVVATGLLALAWPFASIWRTLTKSDAFDATNEAMYRSVAQRTALAIPGFVVLAARFLRRHRDPLALGAAFNVIVYVVGYATGHDAIGRVLPGIMLMAHVALAVWVAELIGGWKMLSVNTRYAISIMVVAIIVVGGISSSAGAIRAVPRALLPARFADDARLASLVAPYDPLTTLIARDDVVVASRQVELAAAASSGRVIAPPAPAPFVDDIARRRRVVAALLSPQTSPSEIRRLVREHNVKWFVVTPNEAQRLQPRVRSGDLRLDLSTQRLRVFRVVARDQPLPDADVLSGSEDIVIPPQDEDALAAVWPDP